MDDVRAHEKGLKETHTQKETHEETPKETHKEIKGDT